MGKMPFAKGSWRACLVDLDDRWASLKYLSLACYSAWILLMMTGSGATTHMDAFGFEHAGELLYKYSGVALSFCLFAAGAFAKRVQRWMSMKPLVAAMGFLASASTFLVCSGAFFQAGSAFAFVIASVGTGVGTSSRRNVFGG